LRNTQRWFADLFIVLFIATKYNFSTNHNWPMAKGKCMFTRKFKTLMLMVTSAVFVIASSSVAMASAPLVKTPAPGFFRLMLGAYEVTAISDGTVDLPVEKLLVSQRRKQQQPCQNRFLRRHWKPR
jgi:hypothetical protein